MMVPKSRGCPGSTARLTGVTEEVAMPKPRFLVLIAVPSAIVLTASQVLAYAFAVGLPVTVSGPSPYAACTAGGTSTSTNYPEAEAEPLVAGNPTTSGNIVGR